MSRILRMLAGLNLPVPEIDWLAAAAPDVVPLLSPSADVAETRDVAYRTGPEATDRHRLDVFAPVGKTGVPVLVFVHGGSWTIGTKDWYAPFGRAMAKAGYLCVLPNYRLSPGVRHPAHAADVAAAVGWTLAHAAAHGGDPARLAVGGHSAGGHLSALVALSPDFGRPAVRAIVGLSGVYRVNERFPGFGLVFPPGSADAASPMTHVRTGSPPVLAAYAERDYITLDRQAEEFAAAVRAAGGTGESLRVTGPDHVTMMVDASAPSGRTHQAIRHFLDRHV
jgi:acetyl esterase/lipase